MKKTQCRQHSYNQHAASSLADQLKKSRQLACMFVSLYVCVCLAGDISHYILFDKKTSREHVLAGSQLIYVR